MSKENEILENLEKAAADAEETLGEAVDTIEEAADKLKETAEEAAETVEEKAAELVESVEDKVSETVEDVKEEIAETVDTVEEKVSDTVKELKTDKPKDSKQKAPQKSKAPAPKKYVSATKKMWIKIGIAAALLIGLAVALVPILNTKSPILTNKTVITIDGVKIPADEFSYYVGYVVDSYSSYYGYEYFENKSNFDSILNYVTQVLKEHYVVYNWALEEGCELTDDEKQEIHQQVEDLKATYESEEEFQNALKTSHLNEALYEKMLLVDEVINKFSDKIYDSETSKYAPDKADVDRLAEENGILASKHILLLSGETPEENDEILAKMNEILERIQNGEDFDELMNEYSEDTGLAQNPNGYTFMPGEMVDEFYDATASLEVGEVSGIVPSSYGYHIIKRIDPDYEETVNRLISVIVNDELQARLDKATMKLGSGFDKIQFSDFGLVPENEETDATE